MTPCQRRSGRLTGHQIPVPYFAFARDKAYLRNPAQIARAARQTLDF
jgi:hypothetical protein